MLFLLVSLISVFTYGVSVSNPDDPGIAIALPDQEEETKDPAKEEAPGSGEGSHISDEVTGEACDWYLHHYPCRVNISKLPKVLEAFRKLGIEVKDGWVDLSYATQYFNHEAVGGEGPCLRGKQVTCNDIFFDILDQASEK